MPVGLGLFSSRWFRSQIFCATATEMTSNLMKSNQYLIRVKGQVDNSSFSSLNIK